MTFNQTIQLSPQLGLLPSDFTMNQKGFFLFLIWLIFKSMFLMNHE